MTSEDDVSKANDGFYAAFESLDIAKMEKVWLKADSIQCIHPGWAMLRGWEPVMTSWHRIFENTEQMKFRLTDVRVELFGALACVTLYENLIQRQGADVSESVVATTNIFEKHPEGWLLVHHHGSPVMQPLAKPAPSTVH